jgi:hypothetical protein
VILETPQTTKRNTSFATVRVILPILLFSGASLVSLVASLVITWFVWEILIYERAFHCIDGGLSIAFWMSADTHESAGDIILPGWTWEKLKLVNGAFMMAFYALWISGSVMGYRILHKECNDDI